MFIIFQRQTGYAPWRDEIAYARIHDNTYLATAPLPSIQYNQKLVMYDNYIVQLFVLHHKNLKKLLKRTFKGITDTLLTNSCW